MLHIDVNQDAVALGGSVVVQVAGDGNQVVLGHAHLTLTRHVGRRLVRRELDWLSPYARSTPLIGRDNELASLNQFLIDRRDVLVRIIHGVAGRGKTRLAVDLCERAQALGWNAGFVTHSELARFLGQPDRATWGWRKPTLVVIDYAAQQAPGIASWVDELADRSASTAPLRVLMIDRYADLKRGWCARIFNRGGYGDSARQALLDPLLPVELLPLANEDERLELIECLRRRIDPACGLLSAREKIALTHRFGSAEWVGDPLFMMMATLRSLRSPDSLAFSGKPNDLATELARREEARLRDVARAVRVDEDLAVHLAACITLAQGVSRQSFEVFADVEKIAIGRRSGGDAAVLADLFAEALPRTDGMAPIMPDLIGEAFVLNALSHPDGRDAVTRCYGHAGITVAQTVVRCLQDFAPQRSEPLSWLEAIESFSADDSNALTALYTSLPLGNVNLSEMIFRVAQKLLEHCQSRPNLRVEDWAYALSRVCVASLGLDQTESSITTAEKVVDTYQSLESANPGKFRAHLASSLSNLAVFYQESLKPDLALRTSDKALSAYRELVARNVEGARGELGGCLLNRANILQELGRWESSLAAISEALEQWRDLASATDGHMATVRAAALNVMSTALAETGKLEQSLYASEQSVELYRDCVARSPETWRVSLAVALNGVAANYIELEQFKPALAASAEALGLYDDIPPQHSNLYLPLFALSSCRMAHAMWELGEKRVALRIQNRAVRAYLKLVEVHPGAYWADLAGALNNLSHMQQGLGRVGAALVSARKSAELCERMGVDNERFAVLRGACLAGLALLLRDRELPDAALEYARKASQVMSVALRQPSQQVGSIARNFRESYSRIEEIVAGNARSESS